MFADESELVLRVSFTPRRAGSLRRRLSDVSQGRIDGTETNCGLVCASRNSCRCLRLYPSDESSVAARNGRTSKTGIRTPDCNSVIPSGMSLDRVRGVLNSKKIQFYESTEPSDGVVLENADTTMTAHAGDTVLVSRFDTKAFEFPCGYDMQIILVFGNDRNLKQRYIHRFRMCP